MPSLDLRIRLMYYSRELTVISLCTRTEGISALALPGHVVRVSEKLLPINSSYISSRIFEAFENL